MAFSPKRYSRLVAAELRAFQRLDAAPPGARPKARAVYDAAARLLARYVERWPMALEG